MPLNKGSNVFKKRTVRGTLKLITQNQIGRRFRNNNNNNNNDDDDDDDDNDDNNKK